MERSPHNLLLHFMVELPIDFVREVVDFIQGLVLPDGFYETRKCFLALAEFYSHYCGNLRFMVQRFLFLSCLRERKPIGARLDICILKVN